MTPQSPLPQDAAALNDIRDNLARYMAALDDRAAQQRDWLEKHETLLLIAHHRLGLFVGQGMEWDAIYMAELLGEAGGMVLATGGMADRAREAFGADSKLLRPRSLFPKHLSDPVALPDLPDGLIPAPVIAPEPEPQAPGKKWWKPGWLSKQPDENIETPHAARQRQRQEWQDAQDRITALQSDRHYYVDSLMDWVGDALATDQPDDAQMRGYRNPRKIAELARDDHEADIRKDVAVMQQRMTLYSSLATLIDTQHIAEFTSALPILFEKPDNALMRRIRDTLLQDYQVVSFAELALTKVKDRDSQWLLFKTALEHEPELKFTGLKKRHEILDRVRAETEKKHNPLNEKALRLARKKLDVMEEMREEGIKRRRPQPVTLADLFNAAVDVIEEAINRRRDAPRAAPRSGL
jgi:hypothetical protein